MSKLGVNYIPFCFEEDNCYYGHCEIQKCIFDTISSDILNSLDKIQTLPGRPFTIGDYGTADGEESYDVMKQCVEKLREKHGDRLPIQLVYEDQPIRDFRPIFCRAQGLLKGTDSIVDNNVFIMAVGCSFYTQCMPQESMDLIFCSCASHWLKKRESTSHYIYFFGNQFSIFPLKLSPQADCRSLYLSDASQVEREAFRKQAKGDWENFLFLRGKELRPGGYLIISQAKMYNNGPNEIAEKWKQISDSAWNSLWLEKTITEDEYFDAKLGMSCLTVEELLEPFRDPLSRVSMCGLKLSSHKTVSVTCSLLEDWKHLRTKHHGEMAATANAIVTQMLGWHGGALRSGLSEDRSKEQKSRIMKEYFRKCIQCVLNDPSISSHRFHSDNLVIYKEKVDSIIV